MVYQWDKQDSEAEYDFRVEEYNTGHVNDQDLYLQNEKWYKTARVIQSIASVFTIPLASTVCSHATVVCLQHCTEERAPNVTLAGTIVVYILIGFNLLGLLATAIYATWFPHWTGSLDTFNMLRLGSSISEHVPLKVSVNDDGVHVLDELPGWLGEDKRTYWARWIRALPGKDGL